MSQYYNNPPQGFQPYTGGTGQQGAQQPATRQQQGFHPPQQAFPSFPPAGAGTVPQMPTTGVQVPGMLPIEQSYIENILRLNKGKLVTVFATFEGNQAWNAKEFKGVIEAAGRDHVILSDPQAGTRYLIPMVAVDYITFSEPIEYESGFGGGGLGTFPPR